MVIMQQTAMDAIADTKSQLRAGGSDKVRDALRRKERSERILVSEGVPVNTDLPLIEPGNDSVPREKDEVAMRTLCVLMTAIKAERMEQPMVLRVVRQYGLAGHFSPREKEFIRNPEPSATEKTRFSWRYEAAWVLLWALGYVDRLQIPATTCDVAFAVACMRDRKTASFITDARLRPLDQILDQADLAYRYHWPLVDAALRKRNAPAGLNTGVVCERHYAFNWLIRSSGQAWDDITTDT